MRECSGKRYVNRRHRRLYNAKTKSVRWIGAIWNVLAQANDTRSDSRAPSRSRRNSFGSSDVGSASTHHMPRHANPSSFGMPAPGQSSLANRYTTDDHVITTPAGFPVSLLHKGSWRLGAGGPERARSLRRVASEADLSDVAGTSGDFGGSESDIANVPLTAENARRSMGMGMGSSRDFTFAGGIPPPPMNALSPPPEYASPIERYIPSERLTFGTGVSNPIPSSGQTVTTESTRTRTFATPQGRASTTVYTSQQDSSAGPSQRFTSSETAYTAPSTFGTAAQSWSTPQSAYTADWSSTQHTRVPAVAITEASPGAYTSGTSSGNTVTLTRSAAFSTAHETLNSEMVTASTAAFNTAQSTVGLGSPFETIEDRAKRLSVASSGKDTASSYGTAPPPVPSKSESASSGSASPRKFQLHDDPVPSYYDTASGGPESDTRTLWTTAATITEVQDSETYLTAMTRPEATRRTTAETGATSYKTAQTSLSGQSEYATAPPPPISRSNTTGRRSSYRSGWSTRDDDAITHVSEPDTDLGLIADLERQSSSGSTRSTALQPRRRVPSTRQSTRYTTADGNTSSGWGTAVTSKYATGAEGTIYETAQGSAYTAAPSYHSRSTYMTTATGTQE